MAAEPIDIGALAQAIAEKLPVAAPAAMSDRQTAAYVGASRRWLWQAVSRGAFPAPVRIGNLTRWRRADVDQFLAGLKPEEGERPRAATSHVLVSLDTYVVRARQRQEGSV